MTTRLFSFIPVFTLFVLIRDLSVVLMKCFCVVQTVTVMKEISFLKTSAYAPCIGGLAEEVFTRMPFLSGYVNL